MPNKKTKGQEKFAEYLRAESSDGCGYNRLLSLA